MSDLFDDLKKLAEMLDAGEVTDSEYEIVKAELMSEVRSGELSSPPTDLEESSSGAEGIPSRVVRASHQAPKWRLSRRNTGMLVGVIGVTLLVGWIGGSLVSNGSSESNSKVVPAAAIPIPTLDERCQRTALEVSNVTSKSKDVFGQIGSLLASSDSSGLRAAAGELDRLADRLTGYPDPDPAWDGTISGLVDALRLSSDAMHLYTEALKTLDFGMRDEAVEMLDEADSKMTTVNALMPTACG